MSFLDAYRRRIGLNNIGGYAGGTLQDQLSNDDLVRQQMRPQMDYRPGVDDVTVLPSGKRVGNTELMLQHPYQDVPQGQPQLNPAAVQQSINPLSRVGQPPQAPPPAYSAPEPTQVDAGAPPTQNIKYDPTTGRPSISMPGVGNDNNLQQYEALQNWEPHGAKRGFKNSLKAGAMYASDAIRNNPNDPVTAAIAGFGTGALGATASPNFKNRLTKDWELRKTGADLSQQLGLQKEQAQIDSLGQVPISVPDGRGGYINTTVPKGKQAQVLGSNARNNIAQDRLGETKRRVDAYVSHIDDLPKEKQAEAARKIWLSGVADGNDELKATLGKRMGITEDLPDSDKGTLDKDANGNIIVVHSRQGTSSGVTNDVTGKPQGSFAATQQKDRNANARAQRENSRGNALIMAGRQAASLGDPAEFERQAADADDDAKDAESEADALSKSQMPSDKATARQLKSEAGRYRRQAREFRIKGSQATGAQRAVGGGQAPAAPAVKGKFDRGKYVKTFQRLHKGTQPTQEQIEQAETMWTNP